MKKKANAFLITALVLQILYITGFSLILCLQKAIIMTTMPSYTAGSIVLPYAQTVITIISLFVQVALSLIIMIQLNNHSDSGFCEICAIVFFLGVIPLLNRIAVPLETYLFARVKGASYLAALATLNNTISIVSFISILAILALVLGCAFSLCYKYYNKDDSYKENYDS